MGPRTALTSRALIQADLPDNFTHALYKIAPYRGCGHGCRYCDGRAERYYVQGDFERDIEVRDGLPACLAYELPRLREHGIIAFGSGVTDPYQPIENDLRITRACASLLAAPRRTSWTQASLGILYPDRNEAATPLPAMVMTKSASALRDLDLWSKVNTAAGFILLVSLTSLDESVRETMEPNASTFAERLALLREFKRAGCIVGVLAMPLLPGISDGEESLGHLLSACEKIGVDFLMPGGLTLRPGRQKDLFVQTLTEDYPQLRSLYDFLYNENRVSGAPIAKYSAELHARLRKLRQNHPLPWLLPHRSFARLLPVHDALRILFQDMIELYTDAGIGTATLRGCAERYDAWLLDRRRFFRRHRTLPPGWLEAILLDALGSGDLKNVFDNPKLLDFTTAIVRDGARFDYHSLSLQGGARG